MRLNVHFGKGHNKVLSNLYPRPFNLTGKSGKTLKFESVEHAYQSLKGGNLDEVVFKNPRWKSGGLVARGKSTKTEGNWNLKLMKRLMKESFKQNPTALAALKATGTKEFSHIPASKYWAKEFPIVLSDVRRNL